MDNFNHNNDYNYDADCDDDYEDNYDNYDNYDDYYNDEFELVNNNQANNNKSNHNHYKYRFLFTEGIYFDEEDIDSPSFNPNCCRSLYLDLANGLF